MYFFMLTFEFYAHLEPLLCTCMLTHTQLVTVIPAGGLGTGDKTELEADVMKRVTQRESAAG